MQHPEQHLSPTASAASEATGTHTTEALGSLLAGGACLLLPLEGRLRFVGSLPSATGVLRPFPVLSVVAVHRAVLACIDIIVTRGNASSSVGVVRKSTPTSSSLSGIDVACVS